MTNFLPEGYESLKTDKPYWKMSQMKEGDNRLRIVTKPIAGWLDWNGTKPVRCRPDAKPKAPYDVEKPVKAFWACYVWDYVREGLYILEITQSTLLKSLTAFAVDQDWGDFTQYDIKINKKGSGKETRYMLTPMPHKPLAPKIEEALRACPVRLEALYEGRDPWTDLKPLDIQPVVSMEPAPKAKAPAFAATGIEVLKAMFPAGSNTEQLDAYVNDIAYKRNRSSKEIIEAACKPALFDKFRANYEAFVDKSQPAMQAS